MGRSALFAPARICPRLYGLRTMTREDRSETDTPSPWLAPAPLPQQTTGARVTLRPWTVEDASGMLEALEDDRESFLPWLPWTVTHNRTVDECCSAIGRLQEARIRTDPPANDFTLGIFERDSGRVIGGTGLHRVLAHAHEAEIGYWIRADRRRRGLCAEAVALLISWAFTPVERGGWNLRRIHIRCAGANASSRKVCESLGLNREAILVKERWVPSVGWDDTIVWGVLREGWDRVDHRVIGQPSRPQLPSAPTH